MTFEDRFLTDAEVCVGTEVGIEVGAGEGDVMGASLDSPLVALPALSNREIED